MTLGGDVDFQQISRKTPGFVGADLSSLTKEAAVVAINRIFSHLSSTSPVPAKDTASGTLVETPETVKGDNGCREDSKVFSDGSVVEPVEQATSEGCGKVEFEAEVAEVPAGRRGVLEGPLSPEQLAPLSVNMEDFLAAVKKVCSGSMLSWVGLAVSFVITPPIFGVFFFYFVGDFCCLIFGFSLFIAHFYVFYFFAEGGPHMFFADFFHRFYSTYTFFVDPGIEQ